MITLGVFLLLMGYLVFGGGMITTLGWLLVLIGVVLLFVRPGNRRYY